MPGKFENLNAILDERHSCRGFQNRQVSQADIEDIVRTASKVPSWCNAQPWKVIVTRGAETAKFSDLLLETAKTMPMEPDIEWPIQYTGDYSERRRVCGYQLYESLKIERGDKERRTEQLLENYRFFGAPHVALITSDTDLGPYGAVDCGGFVALFTVAAQAKGIASVAQASVPGYAPQIRAHFGIPKDRKVLVAISFGYEDENHLANGFRTNRAKIEDVLTFRGQQG